MHVEEHNYCAWCFFCTVAQVRQLWAFVEEEDEKGRKQEERRLPCIITQTRWHWKASGQRWKTQLLTDTVNLLHDSLPFSASLQTHTHAHTCILETEHVWGFEQCHWAFSGWIITLGLSEQSASCPKTCQHPTYPKTSATMACAYGIIAGSLPDTL